MARHQTDVFLKDEVALAGAAVESAEQHIRNAIQSLILADERVAQLLVGGDPMLTNLIRGAEARMFKALFTLGQEGA